MTQVVNDKRLRDTWEASSHARGCGCPSCGRTYKATLDFYAQLGTMQPERESLGPQPPTVRIPHNWYDHPYGRPHQGEDD